MPNHIDGNAQDHNNEERHIDGQQRNERRTATHHTPIVEVHHRRLQVPRDLRLPQKVEADIHRVVQELHCFEDKEHEVDAVVESEHLQLAVQQLEDMPFKAAGGWVYPAFISGKHSNIIPL